MVGKEGMTTFIETFLNNTTMYRLLLYYLMFLLAAALLLAFLGLLSFTPQSLLLSAAFILFCGFVTNKIFAKIFEAPVNVESVYISVFILALIITPVKNIHELPLLFWAAIWTMASKFIFAVNKKHLFNPVAFSMALASLTLNSFASWWVGSLAMLPFILPGVLIVKKIRRYDLVFYFFTAGLITAIAASFLGGRDPLAVIPRFIFDSPLLFFAFVMLTEPQTTPPTKLLQSIYGGLVGFLFAAQIYIGPFYVAPETALLIGNVFSYLVSPKLKMVLKLKGIKQSGRGLYDFTFSSNQKFGFSPGQYMEWTQVPVKTDARGNRRYFTLASSPTEDEIRIGVKFPEERISSFKRNLMDFKVGDKIIASQLAGDFTLPKDKNKKLVFLAGGIGITPFRSMVKYLIDKNEQRDIILFYSNKTAEEVIYKEVFDKAEIKIGLKAVYVLTDKGAVSSKWKGQVGRVNETLITKMVPDYKERVFYLSGPNAMVDYFKKNLKKLGVPGRNIKTDYFPGFA